MTKSHSLDSLTAAHFQEIQGTRFRVTHGPASHEFELVSVTEFPDAAQGTFRKPFSILFHGPLDPVLPQGTHRLEHENLGVLDLFMVPVGPNEPAAAGQEPTAMRYEAVFG
jgi:hypothetical protein